MSVNNSNQEFFSTVISLVSPIGSTDDQDGKAGLSKAAMEMFMFGSAKYPDSAELFRALENTGATFDSSSDSEKSSVAISVPKENREEAYAILLEIFHKTKLREEDLVKVKEGRKMNIDELESDDLEYARSILRKEILLEQDILGTKESVENISLENVVDYIELMRRNCFELRVDGSGIWDLSKKPDLRKLQNENVEFPGKIIFLDREIDQKVLCYGLRTRGLDDYDYATRVVANTVLHSGMSGLVMEKIREENSAAYYAFAAIELMRKKGMVYMAAGVSEENLPKALGLMREIYSDVANGDFEDSRLQMAKKYVRGSIDRIYDDLPGLANFYENWVCRGKEIPQYEQLVDQLESVSKESVAKFFAQIIKDQSGSLVINGSVSKKTKNRCGELMK